MYPGRRDSGGELMAELTEYTALITSEHRDKPRFMAVVGALVQPLVDQMNVLQSMPGKFDLDNAVGVQLDDVGLWVGVSRKIRTPLTGIYFSFDIDGLGFDQGTWKGPFDPDTGLTVLDDDTYRLVIRAKIGANRWDGTLESSAAILNSIFGNPSGDLVPVHANGEAFGTGDGITKNFPLTYSGAQVRRVDSATLYRNDWQGNQQLYPTARTNIAFYSSTLSNGAGATPSNGSFVGASIGLPDTTTGTAYAFVPNTTSTTHYFDSKGAVTGSNTHVSVPIGTPLSMSIWLKASGYSIAELRLYNNARVYLGVRVDLTSGSYRATTGGGSQTGFAASNISVYAGTNGWYRLSFTCVAPNDTGTDWIPRVLVYTGTLASPTQTFSGDGTSGVYAWGRHYELASAAGSYIPTTTSPVTVTDYALSSSGVAQLAVTPPVGAKLSWTGDGAVYQQGTRVFIEDHQDMSMTIGIAGKVPSAVFLALLAGGYIPLKPEGVRVAYTVVTSVDGAPLFGFDMDNELVAGFDTGVWGTPV